MSRKNRELPFWDGNVQALEPLGNGVSGMTWGIDTRRVAKVHIGSAKSRKDIETEREIYRKLQENQVRHVLFCYETDNPSGLVLQRCQETLRQRLQFMTGKGIWDEKTIIRWVYQAGQALTDIHNCNIIHGDVGCHNILLDSADMVRIADFAGSSINGSPVTVEYEPWSRFPGSKDPDGKSDLFAFGSTIFEMATGRPPFYNLPSRIIYSRFKEHKHFQELGKLSSLRYQTELDSIIRRCWKRCFNSANDIVLFLEEHIPRSWLQNPNPSGTGLIGPIGNNSTYTEQPLKQSPGENNGQFYSTQETRQTKRLSTSRQPGTSSSKTEIFISKHSSKERTTARKIILWRFP